MAKFKKAYVRGARLSLVSQAPSRTQQNFKNECDINRIMARWQKTGLVTHLNEHHGNYGDLMGFEDYQSSMNAIIAAQDSFMSLPSDVRKKFDNDPSLFLRFAQDPKNEDALVEMGLAHKRPTEFVDNSSFKGSKEPDASVSDASPSPTS